MCIVESNSEETTERYSCQNMGQVFALALFVEELCYDVGKWRTEDME